MNLKNVTHPKKNTAEIEFVIDKLSFDNAVNAVYHKSFEVKNIPCDQIYLNLHLKTDYLDSSKVNAVHKELYNHLHYRNQL